MKQFEIDFSENPSFNTVINLTNKTFDPNNVEEGRMATEDQILQLEQRYDEVQQTVDHCCRDIVVWKTFTRIINRSGITVSNFGENVNIGTTRRGLSFNVRFNPPFNTNKYLDHSGVPSSFYEGNAFWFWYSPSAMDQQNRKWTEEVLYKSTNLNDVLHATCEFPDDPSYTSASCYNPFYGSSRMSNVSFSYDTSFPIETSNFNVYLSNDGYLTIDVKSKILFRGMSNVYQNDPAYSVIFVTQFVEK